MVEGGNGVQGNGAAGDHASMVRTMHVVEGTATSVSSDDTTGMLQFLDPSKKTVAMTFPIKAIPALRAMLDDLEAEIIRRKGGKTHVHPRVPESYRVAHSDSLRGHVMLFLDPDTPRETVLVFNDQSGLQLAGAIHNDILGRMTPQQRAKMQTGLSVPPQRQLILPGK